MHRARSASLPARAGRACGAAIVALSLLAGPDPVVAQSRPPASGFTARPAASRPLVIDLAVGQAHVLDERNVRRIAVGNGKVVQVTALDQRQIQLLPEAAGQSTLHLWGKDCSEKHYLINVSATDARRTAE